MIHAPLCNVLTVHSSEMGAQVWIGVEVSSGMRSLDLLTTPDDAIVVCEVDGVPRVDDNDWVDHGLHHIVCSIEVRSRACVC
jgi:hypothetical protein